MTLFTEIFGVAGLVALGAGSGYAFRLWRQRCEAKMGVREAERIVLEGRREAESLVREARLTSAEEAHKLREQGEKGLLGRRRELSDLELRLSERENLINGQLTGLLERERRLLEDQQSLGKREIEAGAIRQTLDDLAAARRTELQKLAQMDPAEAKRLFLKEVEKESLADANDLSRHLLDAARAKAEEQARRIISLAIQRYAGPHTFESTTATVNLPGEEMKGRIIGREGRNIRAFELATGVTVMIDDTPNAVVLSGFDPVRREIARESMTRLILDGRIHPTRIEEVVAQVSREIDETILRAGEEALLRAGLTPAHLEIVKLLGRLRFRHSFSQNILDHSVEVAQLMGLMASELGIDPAPARRAGLFHDIGKAMNHEVEGSHAIIGADFIKRYGESEAVVNGVASHHDEVPHVGILGILVSAADAISASRPGARLETMSTYLKRLESLEQIGMSMPGVDKCFAVQAGRELRVIVQPDKINDDEAAALARNLVKQIEGGLHYPGQIRITVIREKRCVEFAK